MKRIWLVFAFSFPLSFNADDLEKNATEVYIKSTSGFWGYTESDSGPGSSLEQTKNIREQLPLIFTAFNIESILDIPCGDFNWMRHTPHENITYIGDYIVAPLVERNRKRYGNAQHTFLHLDITKDHLPRVDLVICRDLLIHLSISDAMKALKNIKKSGAKYLLTTTFTSQHRINRDVQSILSYYPVNLQKPPFNLPTPLMIINENCTEQGGIYGDKSLGLWLVESLNFE